MPSDVGVCAKVRALRWSDSSNSIRRFPRASPDSRESSQGSRVEPFFLCESDFGALQIANRRFGGIRANRSNIMKILDKYILVPLFAIPSPSMRVSQLWGYHGEYRRAPDYSSTLCPPKI